MLCSLYIENIALIRRLSLEPEGGFCAFTGETGAGKSIIIDSLSLLCGARSDRGIIRTGEDSALVEGVFSGSDEAEKLLLSLDISPEEDGSITLTRRLSSDGRSVSKINGRPVPLSKLKTISSLLVSIHGQKDTYAFAEKAKQLSLLDGFAHDGNELKTYAGSYETLRGIDAKLSQIRQNEREKAQRLDMLKYRISELKNARVMPGEQKKLIETRNRLANLEKLMLRSGEAYDALYGDEGSAVESVKRALDAVNSLYGVIPEAEELSSRLESGYEELKDISETLAAYKENEGNDSMSLDDTETRLELIRTLSRKYSCEPDNFPALLAGWEDELTELENAGETENKLVSEREKALKRLEEDAFSLTSARKKAAETLCGRTKEELCEVDMPNVRFEVAFGKKDYSPDGNDDIEFLVSANLGEMPRPMAECASGGELSRIMLCLKCVFADSESIGTLIFDEIDSGISGITSEKIGIRLKKASDNGKTQVICVTHSAILAAKADAHYKISKRTVGERTETEIEKLEGENRLEEISRILGGMKVSDAVRTAAAELLAKE